VTNTEGLPLVYSPEIISAYWGTRPGAVATRVVQLLSVAGGFISGIISDLISDKIKEVLTNSYTSRFAALFISCKPIC
jgi:aarF domain-containing kinase